MVDYTFIGLSKLAILNLFKKKPKDIALKREVEQAKWESYRKGRLAQAKKEGFRKGAHHRTRTQQVFGALEGFGASMGSLGGLESGLSSDFLGLGTAPRKKRKGSHKKKGRRTITIRY